MPGSLRFFGLALAVALASAACSSPDEEQAGGVGGGSGAGGRGAGGAAGVGGAAGEGGSFLGPPIPSPPCPPDMAHVGPFCMDRYEAPNAKGAPPLVMQSAVLAEAYCAERGRRLCTEDEWVRACEGQEGATYPYGDAHEEGRCNDEKTWRVVDEGALATWPSPEAQAELDALWQGAPSGDYDGCVGDAGVFDLTGNIEEWVVRTQPHANDYPHVLKGCYWAGCFGGSKPTCGSTNPAHADGFMFYETGFRCCADASEPR